MSSSSSRPAAPPPPPPPRSLILDVQWFKEDKDTIIPKELAAYDGHKLCHYIFTPPYPLRKLPNKKYRKHNKWLMENCLGLRWNDGFTPLYQFKKIISQLSKGVDVIYVKGKEKANFLRKFINSAEKPFDVVEFTEQPSLSPSTPPLAERCFFHRSKSTTTTSTNSTSKCALSNVLFLYDTFMCGTQHRR